MPNEGEVVIFEFDFEGKTNAKELPNSRGQLDVREAEEAAVEHFNAKADELAQDLQKEVERVFQPLTTGSAIADVEVAFRYESRRSIVAHGVAMALAPLVPFAADVAVGALGPLVGKLLEGGFKRVIRLWQQREQGEALGSHEATLEPITMNVSTRQVLWPTARPPSPEPSPPETCALLSGQSSTPWLQVQQQTNPPPPIRETSGEIETSGAPWLLPAIAIGTAVVVVLLAVILTIVIMQAP
jgi:hypothetical protein